MSQRQKPANSHRLSGASGAFIPPAPHRRLLKVTDVRYVTGLQLTPAIFLTPKTNKLHSWGFSAVIFSLYPISLLDRDFKLFRWSRCRTAQSPLWPAARKL
jgi:hypothetical protein